MKKNLRNLMMLSLVAGTLSMTSCRDAEEKKDEPAEPMQNEMHQSEDQAKMKTYEGETLEAEFKDENTAEIYNLYVEIKDAFVNTDAEAAGDKAAELAEKAGENKEIASAAMQIAENDDVNTQRENFSTLTAAMEPVLQDALESGEIYKQYCPMAFEGKGDYWYSNSKDIFNPYYGNKMLKCGRVEATLN
ncbi:DUF3347 domain-containing protein [Salegentibacter salegens]|uniref:DUF3347 domain-containing protein n=1 Tax=Salegentibacter salegens TaxID=143223 RepID=A0A1M7N9P3_9FLAO|nr:DUF3347 domain-containing protein [Salegentibacter salegens]PRX45692.1 uncharacterized protein DUF3347 [Salegentibacter salegens]SHM99855.1 Protein of unknown function [Salegentibacter salegens]